MDSDTGKQAPNINIDIKGELEESTSVKNNMNLEARSEARAGLSKEELMKYANQPFWVRLRNVLFASFWIMWISILVAAIGYVVHSPGCSVSASSAPQMSSSMASTLAPSSSTS